jgi:CubicO group peptidase (beta-lactamase class C family)
MKLPLLFSNLVVAAMFAGANVASAGDVRDDAVASALPRLQAYIEEAIDAGLVPGLSVAVVYKDEVVFLEGFGVREVGKPEKVDADTVFQIASLSKPLASTVVAAIVSQGTVSWDSRMAEIDPDFQLYEAYPSAQVTIRDLFSHTSGLPGLAGDDLEAMGFDRDTILERLRLVPPLSSFRSAYSYSNFGLTAGAQAAAQAAGMSWEEASQVLLYEPLGMTESSSLHADFLEQENRAVLHAWHDDAWQALALRQPDAQSPAGGVSSNARDLAQWMRLQLGDGMIDGRRLIDPAALAQTHTPVIERGIHRVTGLPSFYALGWNISYGPRGPIWAHAGAFSTGARTVANLLPQDELGIVVISNAFPTGMPEAISNTFFDLVFEGEATRDWATAWNGLYGSMFGPAMAEAIAFYGTPPAAPAAAFPSDAYVGTYANAYAGEAIVREEAGGLTLSYGPDASLTFPLIHFDRDLFLYYPYAETPDFPSLAQFVIGADQVADSLMLEDLEHSGHATLGRQPD